MKVCRPTSRSGCGALPTGNTVNAYLQSIPAVDRHATTAESRPRDRNQVGRFMDEGDNRTLSAEHPTHEKTKLALEKDPKREVAKRGYGNLASTRPGTQS